eukprot:5199426-Amphidinium_carterae.1
MDNGLVMVKEAHEQPQPQSYQYGHSGYSGQSLYTGQPTAFGNAPYKGKGYGQPQHQQWNNFGKGKKGQVANIAGDSEDPNAYGEQWHPYYAQEQSYAWVPDSEQWNYDYNQ